MNQTLPRLRIIAHSLLQPPPTPFLEWVQSQPHGCDSNPCSHESCPLTVPFESGLEPEWTFKTAWSNEVCMKIKILQIITPQNLHYCPPPSSGQARLKVSGLQLQRIKSNSETRPLAAHTEARLSATLKLVKQHTMNKAAPHPPQHPPLQSLLILSPETSTKVDRLPAVYATYKSCNLGRFCPPLSVIP